MPRAFLIKNKKPVHPPPGSEQQGAAASPPGGDEERCSPGEECREEEPGCPGGRLASCTSTNSHMDPTSIYPSPSPSSEEPCTRDDTSMSSSDDEHRDRTERHDHDAMTSAEIRASISYDTPASSPDASSCHPMTFPTTRQAPVVIIPIPRNSPEPDVADDSSSSRDRNSPVSPRRRRRSDDDDDDENDAVMPMPPALCHSDVMRHHHPDMVTSKNQYPPVGSAPDASYWHSHLAGMGLGLSMAVHHPYLALSFQRLQQLHLHAAQEGSLPKRSPFHPHLPLPPHNHHQPLPFAPLPGGMAGVPLRPPHHHPHIQPPSSPVQGCSSDYPFPTPHTRLADRHNADFPQRSPSGSSTGSSSNSHSACLSASSNPRVIAGTPPSPGLVGAVLSMSGGREDGLPLDLDTKTAAEKRKRREGEPPRYNCEACGKTYSTFSGLSKHKQFHCASHIQKQFNCKYCDKTYVSLGALKMHIRTHTLPCKCHLCGKAFSRPWLLQGHVRTHTGEKPFQCAHCGRSFADRSNLRAHLQTHSDVKKYSCRTCSKTFSRMSLLLKHEDGGCSDLGH